MSETVVVARLMEHWLFWREPPVPTTAGTHWLPASFSRYKVFEDRKYSTAQEFEPLELLRSNHTHAEDTLAAPFVSAYCRVNVWFNPVPEPGETEVTEGVPLPEVAQVPRETHPVLAPVTSYAIR